MTAAQFVDETEFGFGWRVDGDPLRRTSHALLADGRVYAIDPVEGDGVDERIGGLGERVAVLVLLDRHRRDADAFAARFGVPVHETPFDRVPGAPFAFRPIKRSRFWREVALWWAERRVLVTADALGTIEGYFCARDEPLGLHPFLRLTPPRRPLEDLEPEHVLVGHGEGVHGTDAAPALRSALATSRRRLPGVAAAAVGRARRQRVERTRLR